MFKNSKLSAPLLKAIEDAGYTNPTPIQEKAIPAVLQGKDVLGCAQTGTGKTAAFSLPILEILLNKGEEKKRIRAIKALVLCPTRELATQIGETFKVCSKYTTLKHTVVFGGVSQHAQTEALNKGVDVLIATPGRLMDLMDQGYIHLKDVEILVLDEADRMLDMGFIHAIKKIIQILPAKKQSLFFSATMSPPIQKLADSILVAPVKIEIAPVSSTAESVEQSMYFVEKGNKKSLLIHLLKNAAIESAIVFTRTKHGADRITKDLNKSGIKAEAIHGNKSQNARQRALSNFKAKEISVLVATDIAARGIDIDKLSHVINFELPEESETYVHRIGRTGRAGESGKAISFCDAEEEILLKQISKLIGKTIPVVKDHPYSYEFLPREQVLLRAPKKPMATNNRRWSNNNNRVTKKA